MSTATIMTSSILPLAARTPKVQTPELIVAVQDVLAQGLQLLNQLGDHNYSQVAAEPYRASVGQHYRHILEHFQSLTQGRVEGSVNYDSRQRNRRIENEVAYASDATCDVLRSVKQWNERVLDDSCQVVSSVAYSSNAPSKIQSTIGRELAYCVGHAIHHYAIIRLICAEQGVEVPPEFGYAPATLKHMSSFSTM